MSEGTQPGERDCGGVFRTNSMQVLCSHCSREHDLTKVAVKAMTNTLQIALRSYINHFYFSCSELTTQSQFVGLSGEFQGQKQRRGLHLEKFGRVQEIGYLSVFLSVFLPI